MSSPVDPAHSTGQSWIRLSTIRLVVAALLLFFLFGYILFPALKTLQVSLISERGNTGLSTYIQLVASDAHRVPLMNSILLGVLSVLVCGAVGTTLAFLIHFFEFPCRSFLDRLLLIPIMLPGIIIVFSFVQLYGESGLVTKTVQLLLNLEEPPFDFSGLSGILFVHAYTQYVYFYISVSIAVKHIDHSVIESARSLGASKEKVFVSIILPFLAPALVAASVITFMSGIGSFTAPSIIGGGFKVLTTQILLAKANNYMNVAATQVVVLTLISLVLFSVFRIYEAKAVFSSSVKGVRFRPVRIRNRNLRLLMSGGVLILTVIILLPVLTIILLSFVPSESWMVSYYPETFSRQNYIDIFTRSRKFAPFLNSMFMALAAAGIGLAIALPCSYIIVKTTLRFKWLIEILAMLPWAMPASAIGINLINAFNQPSVFSMGQVWVGTSILLPLGYLIRSLPIVIKTVNLSFQHLNPTYIEASKSLGAPPGQTFKRIVLPILSPGLLAGFLLIFVRSIGEYTISVFLYNASNKPVSIAMVNGIFEYNIGLAMAYGTLLIGMTIIVTLLVSRFSPFPLR